MFLSEGFPVNVILLVARLSLPGWDLVLAFAFELQPLLAKSFAFLAFAFS